MVVREVSGSPRVAGGRGVRGTLAWFACGWLAMAALSEWAWRAARPCPELLARRTPTWDLATLGVVGLRALPAIGRRRSVDLAQERWVAGALGDRARPPATVLGAGVVTVVSREPHEGRLPGGGQAGPGTQRLLDALEQHERFLARARGAPEPAVPEVVDGVPLTRVPGIGPRTAAAVAAFLEGRRAGLEGPPRAPGPSFAACAGCGRVH